MGTKTYGSDFIRRKEAEAVAHFCPQCGARIGTPDFEPADYSVGINAWMYGNWCDVCEVEIWTYEDSEQELIR